MRKSIILTAFAIFCLVTIAANAANFLEEEAGICAYTNAGRTINLALVKPLYRTIEHETVEYVIGSMPIGDYPETEDVHVYVHKDGWVAAYYSANEPVSKIIDWRSYQGTQITSTKLELALVKVSTAVNFPLVGVKYYDFVCPQANKLLMVIDREDSAATDSFDIMIPGDLIIYERSWGLYGTDAYNSILLLNESEISSLGNSDNIYKFSYGKLLPDQLQQDIFHTFSIINGWYVGKMAGWSAGGIVLVYQQP